MARPIAACTKARGLASLAGTALMAALLLAAPAAAQTPQPQPAAAASPPAGGLSEAELKGLISTLEDPAARRAFVANLRALLEAKRRAAPETGPGERAQGFLADLSERVRHASARVVEAAGVALDAPKLWRWLVAQASAPETRALWLAAVWQILLVLAAGVAAEFVTSRLLARPRRAVEGRESDNILVRLPFLVARTVLDLIPIIAFAGAAYGLLPLLEPGEATRLVALTVVYASLLARALLAVARAILVPRVPSLRLLTIPDETAAYLYVWVRRLTHVAVYGTFTAQALLLLGLPRAGYAFILKVLGLLFAAMVVSFILQNRRPVARWLQGRGAGTGGGLDTLRARFADIWHVLAVLYVVAAYLVWALEVEGGFDFLLRATVLSVVILAAAGLAAVGVRRAVSRIFTISADLKETYPLLEERANRYLPAIQMVLRAAIFAFAALGVLQAWGLDTFGWLTSDAGRRLISGAVTIAVVMVVALLFWELVSSAIERYLSRAEGAEGAARLRTLLPLARKAVLATLVVLVSLVVLSEIGVNIAPLLAGAGVVGLAVGFGAQSLVKDVITGLFILVEDAVAVGDVVEVAGHAGLVEGLTIRSIRLRDLSGTVHTIPFSEVATVKNMTKDFSYALMNIGVAYREDVDEVIEVIKEVADELRADPEIGPLILEPIEVLGLDAFGDSAVVIKARIKTRPIKQWTVQRAYNRLLKRAFDARGIEIPFPHTTLYFGEDKEGRAPPAHVRVETGEIKAEEPGASRKPTLKPVDLPGGGAGDGGD